MFVWIWSLYVYVIYGFNKLYFIYYIYYLVFYDEKIGRFYEIDFKVFII